MKLNCNKISNDLKIIFDELNPKLLFIHSNVLFGLPIRLKEFNRSYLLNSHLASVFALKDTAFFWFPTFNYDFPNTGFFSANNSPSQVGHLSEFFRLEYSEWRTLVPMFSIAGTGPELSLNINSGIVDPFDKYSFFSELIKNNGYIFYYGADFSSTTFIHFIERQANILPYRYDKYFSGIVYSKDCRKFEITLKHHVRPRGCKILYDWQKLFRELKINNLIKGFSTKRSRFYLLKASDLYKFWKEKIDNDPLYFLDNSTKDRINPLLDKLGRSFKLTDFE